MGLQFLHTDGFTEQKTILGKLYYAHHLTLDDRNTSSKLNNTKLTIYQLYANELAWSLLLLNTVKLYAEMYGICDSKLKYQ